MTTSVDDLIKVPFSCRSRSAKIKILTHDKPRPPLPNFFVYGRDKGRDHRFETSEYERINWLTACDRRYKLFCWPCLLFGPTNTWNTTGMDGLMLKQRIHFHQMDQKHIQGLLNMKLFISQNVILNPINNIMVNQHVKRNREIMKRIIDTVCFLVLQKYPLNKDSEDKNQLTTKECAEGLQFLHENGISDEDDGITEDAVIVLQNAKNLLNHVVDSVTHMVKLAIKRETQASAFVSLILSGHGGTESPIARRSTVLRYIKNGKVCERFVGFHQVKEANGDEFFEVISKVVSEFQLSQRILSLSLDGTFPRPVLDAIRTDLSTIYPYATVVPCYFHKFRDVLRQSLSDINACNSFFKMMEAMISFLQKDRVDFEQFLKGKVSVHINFDSVTSPDTLNLVKLLRKILIQYFDFMLQDCDNRKTDYCMKAYAFRQFLSEFYTVFWLEFFIRLFSITNDICQILDSPMPETAFEGDMVGRFSQSLVSEKERGFENFWNGIIDHLQTDMEDQIRDIDKRNCWYQFLNVLEVMQYQNLNRLKQLPQLEFFHLLNPSKFNPIFSKPLKLITQLNGLYGSSFDPPHLTSEIESLYLNNKDIIGFSVEQLLGYMNFRMTFRFLIRLAELILTMPCKRPSDAHSSILDKIDPFSHSFTIYSGDYSLLCIERELLDAIRRKKSFYDDVITVFFKLNNSIEWLLFKT